MNRGLILRALRDTGPATIGFTLALFVIELFLGWVLPTYAADFEGPLLRIEFVRRFLGALLGTEVGEGFATSLAQGLPWVHPVVLVVVWGHAVMCCTRVPVGEVDRGTIDVLLGLPITRWELWIAETVAWMLSGGFLLGIGVIGFATGTAIGPGEFPRAGGFAAVLLNAGALYLAVGGLTWLLSAISERRGRALGAAFGILLASFLVQFLAELWEPARRLAFLSFLDYYRPLDVLRADEWPLANVAVLLVAAIATWVAGGVIFQRRDVHVL